MKNNYIRDNNIMGKDNNIRIKFLVVTIIFNLV